VSLDFKPIGIDKAREIFGTAAMLQGWDILSVIVPRLASGRRLFGGRITITVNLQMDREYLVPEQLLNGSRFSVISSNNQFSPYDSEHFR
jgi:hypothetical protein